MLAKFVRLNRTIASGAVYLGSSPSPAANLILNIYSYSKINSVVVLDSNRRGVGRTSGLPWRKVWENRGFPRGERSKSGSQLVIGYRARDAYHESMK